MYKDKNFNSRSDESYKKRNEELLTQITDNLLHLVDSMESINNSIKLLSSKIK